MNKKGLVPLLALMLATVVIILALSLAGPTKTQIDETRNNATAGVPSLNCDNATINDFDRVACTSTDLITPAFIGSLIGFAGLIVGARFIFSS